MVEFGIQLGRFDRAAEALWLAAERPIRWAAAEFSGHISTERRGRESSHRTDPSKEAVIRVAIITNLLAYSTVVSQPLFYIVALTSAQRAMSGSAYVELRQSINAVMNRRVPAIYLTTLVTILVLLVLSWRAGTSRVLITTIVALLCLVADIALMVRENVPINGVIDRWSTTNYPGDWDVYRNKWFAIFGYRQVVLLVGFISLLFGAVFQG